MERERSLSSPFENAFGTTSSKDGACSKHGQAAKSPTEDFRDITPTCHLTQPRYNHTSSVSPSDCKDEAFPRRRQDGGEQNGRFHAYRTNPTQLSERPKPSDACTTECLKLSYADHQAVSFVVENSTSTNGLASSQTAPRKTNARKTRKSSTSAKHTRTRNRHRVEYNADTKDSFGMSSESKRLPGIKTAQDSDKKNTNQAYEANNEKKGSAKTKKDHDKLQEDGSKGNSNGELNTNSEDGIGQKKMYTVTDTKDRGKERPAVYPEQVSTVMYTVTDTIDRRKERPAVYREQVSTVPADDSMTYRPKEDADCQHMLTKTFFHIKTTSRKQNSDIKLIYSSGANTSNNDQNVFIPTSKIVPGQNQRLTKSGIQHRKIATREDIVASFGDPEARDRTAVSSEESLSTRFERAPKGNQATVKQLTSFSSAIPTRRPRDTAESNDRMGIKGIHKTSEEGRQHRLRQARRHSALKGVSESIPPGDSGTPLQKLSQTQVNTLEDNTRTNPDQAKRSGHAIQQSNGIQSARPKQKAEESKHRQSEATSERYIKKTQFRSLTEQTQADTTKEGLEEKIREFVVQTFPHVHEKTYFVPATPFNVSKRLLLTDIPGFYIMDLTPHSNARADEARERLLQALQDVLADKVSFVMSGFIFEEYLNKPNLHQDPGRPREKLKMPFPKPGDLPPQYRRGEIEVIVIHKTHGIIIMDVKAVGDTFDELNKDEQEELEVVGRVLEKALTLMRKEKDVILHVVSDIPCTVPVSTMLVLPNLSRTMLKKVLDSDPGLRKALTLCIRNKQPVEDECLCADELPAKHRAVTDDDVTRLLQWWNRCYPEKPPVLEDNVYEQIIGRFCGPLSTFSVWTAETPRVEVRTLGQAVHETGKRFSTLILLPQQRDVLASEERLVYLVGPPGSGKTLLLILKGVQWVREGRYVCVLTAKAGPSPVALVIMHQIKNALSQYSNTTSHGEVQADTVLSVDSSNFVGRLKAGAKGRPICLIMDEIHGEVLPLIRRIIQQVPNCTLWCAGAWATTCPSSFVLKLLPTSVRCPPAVQSLLQMIEPSKNWPEESLTSSTEYSYVTHSTMIAEKPLPTTGVRVKLMSHDGHDSPQILDCATCADKLATYLKDELRVGEDIQAEDVLILSADKYALEKDLRHSRPEPLPIFARTLLDLHLDVEVISQFTGRECQLAFPSSKKMTLTSFRFVTGLERKVVVFLPEGAPLRGSGVRPASVELREERGDIATNVPNPPTSVSMETVLTTRTVCGDIQTTAGRLTDDSPVTSGNETGARNGIGVMPGGDNGVTSVTSPQAVRNATEKEANEWKRDENTERKKSNSRKLGSSENDAVVEEDVNEDDEGGPGRERGFTKSIKSPRPAVRAKEEDVGQYAGHHEKYANDWNRDDYSEEKNPRESVRLRRHFTIENHSDDEDDYSADSEGIDLAIRSHIVHADETDSKNLDSDIDICDCAEADVEKHPADTTSKLKDPSARNTENSSESTNPSATSPDITRSTQEAVNICSQHSSAKVSVQATCFDASSTLAGCTSSPSPPDLSNVVDKVCGGDSNRRDPVAGTKAMRGEAEGDTAHSYHSRLRAAVAQLSVTNRERMWYAVSRALSHVVVFHFRNQ